MIAYVKVKELIKMLEANGFEMVRQRGDHRQFKKQGWAKVVTVPGHLSDTLKPGLLNSILKSAGLK